MREIIFRPVALEQYSYWAGADKKTFKKINSLVEEILKTPFVGIGKPEALKHNLQGCWSRRISKGHRLVYQVTVREIIIISCRFHY